MEPEYPPRRLFTVGAQEKESAMLGILKDTIGHLRSVNEAYSRMVGDVADVEHLSDLPWITTDMFKGGRMGPGGSKVLRSSGTSGDRSVVPLDAEDSRSQKIALSRIISEFFHIGRVPMLIVGREPTSVDTAKDAGSAGFRLIGYDICHALDDQGRLDVERVRAYLESHCDEKVVIYGTTIDVYEKLLRPLIEADVRLGCENAVIIHGGGWKRSGISVDNETFKGLIREYVSPVSVSNFYGMVEQLGAVYFECEHGHLHCSEYSDVIVRDKRMRVCGVGEEGIIETISIVPKRYPGNVLLTRDIGAVCGVDDCPCGRKGRYFRFVRRADSVIVGCSTE